MINEKEIATKRTVMRTYNGKLRPIKISIKDHNVNTPKKTRIEGEPVNEDSTSRADRSNEYSLHSKPIGNTALSAPKKFRLKHKETGSTMGMHNTYAEAETAWKAHPKKNLLKIEDAELDASALLRMLVDVRNSVDESCENKQPTLSFSAYREIFESIGDEIDAALEEARALLLDKKKKKNSGTSDIDLNEGSSGLENLRAEHKKVTELFNKADTAGAKRIHRLKLMRLRDHARKHYSIDLNENAFNWKAPTDRPDWSDKDKDGDRTEIKTKKTVVNDAPKKAVGRPSGSYGKYKTADRSEADKKAIADKVHNNPERKANYADAIAARKEFKTLMNNSIKKRQANLTSK